LTITKFSKLGYWSVTFFVTSNFINKEKVGGHMATIWHSAN